MSSLSLEERVARLETLVGVADTSTPNSPRQRDWRRTVGMFRGDPVMKEVIDEALRLREEEREEARAAAREGA